MSKVAAAFAAWLFSAAASAADLPAALEEYWKASQRAQFLCSLQADVWLLEAGRAAREGGRPAASTGPVADPVACADQELLKVKSAYEKALATLKKPEARAALKEHLVITNVAVKGVVPGANDTKRGYQERKSVNERRMEEQWERVKLEL